MKLIILAAGKNIESLDADYSIPKCLLEIEDKSILTKLLENAQEALIDNITIVCGDGIEKIVSKFPKLNCIYNDNWASSSNLTSLYIALKNCDDDIIVAYSDILYPKEIFKKLMKVESGMSIVYDSKLNSNRYNNFDVEAEKLYLNEKKILEITKNYTKKKLIGEYVGLVKFSKNRVSHLKNIIKRIILDNKEATLIELINHEMQNENYKLVDIIGKWQEIDTPVEVSNFNFSTKSNTLKQLEVLLTKSIVLPQVSFFVKDFEENRDKIIEKIQKKFQDELIIIRSSSIKEDTYNSSMAGGFDSILNIKANSKNAIESAILKVKESYTKKENFASEYDQIFVQKQLIDVDISGVIFTRDLESHAPYITINYHEGKKTDSITSGDSNDSNTIVIKRDSDIENLPEAIKRILDSIDEVEKVVTNTSLDIEFAANEDHVYILQVRPIATYKNKTYLKDKDIDNEVKEIQKYIKISKNNSLLLGNKYAYGIMPDWNPAEIIGINPSPLSLSLYTYLISDSVWSESRKILSYRDTSNCLGIISLCGKPYVDVRMSFNSLTPSEINEDIATRLIDYYIERLQKNPHYHDKIEFNIVLNVLDFNFNTKRNELIEYFSSKEIKIIEKSLRNLTNNIINEKISSIKENQLKLDILAKNRNKILSLEIDKLMKIKMLLDDCKINGTLPFSILARFAFIGTSFLKSMVDNSLLSENEYNSFFNNINTVSDDFINDLYALTNNTISYDTFMSRYGHLRPGTYDINSKTYKEAIEDFINLENVKSSNKDKKNFFIENKKILKIDEMLSSIGLDFSYQKLIVFIKQSIKLREFAKLEFTKNLSISLDLLKEWAAEHNISSENLMYFSLTDILNYIGKSYSSNFDKEIINYISHKRTKFLITKSIKLPELIFAPSDVIYFTASKSRPNFISSKKVLSKIVFFSNTNKNTLNDKIVVIENADPGYDWIFTYNIKGLITKYGGAASHMAIRCAEFDLPAMIGCGDIIFEKLHSVNTIELDCINKSYRILS